MLALCEGCETPIICILAGDKVKTHSLDLSRGCAVGQLIPDSHKWLYHAISADDESKMRDELKPTVYDRHSEGMD